jgi:hypothetical protein
MWPRSVSLPIWTTIAMSMVGCSLIAFPVAKHPPQTRSMMSMQDLADLEECFIGSQDSTTVPKPDLESIRVGQHLQILGSRKPTAQFPDLMASVFKVAGTVKQMGTDGVVLQDAVIISHESTVTGTSVVSKVPHFGRLFSNTGTRRSVTAVPGEVLIECASILAARELTAEAFESVREHGEIRIGVDYDAAEK